MFVKSRLSYFEISFFIASWYLSGAGGFPVILLSSIGEEGSILVVSKKLIQCIRGGQSLFIYLCNPRAQISSSSLKAVSENESGSFIKLVDTLLWPDNLKNTDNSSGLHKRYPVFRWQAGFNVWFSVQLMLSCWSERDFSDSWHTCTLKPFLSVWHM